MSDSAFVNPFDVIDDSENEDNSIVKNELPQEIEQTLKKIAKRDIKTRTRGFNELLDHLRQLSDVEFQDLSPNLRGTFVKIFLKFIICGEKICRIHVAEVSNILICKSDPKTFLQPILKEILTGWLLSLFDPIVEVSSLQRKTLETVFPAATKLKILLDKYEQTILKEIGEYCRNNEKFELLKSVTMNELEGSTEEAEEVIELVKTEIVGLVSLFAKNEIKEEMLFLKDKSLSNSRRCALYRLAALKSEIISKNLEKFIGDCLKKENSPTGLSMALDLLERTDKDIFLGVLKGENFTISVLSNAPVAEFKKYSNILCSKLNEENLLIKAQEFVKICGLNNFMNKERFLAFWKEVAVGIFTKISNFEDKNEILRSLLYPSNNNSKNNLKSLTAFFPLTAEETVNCIREAFSENEILIVCKGNFNIQSAYVLSNIETEDLGLLENIIENISLSDLQNKELMKVLPESALTKRLMILDDKETLNSAEMVRLIQSLPEGKAIKVLEIRGFRDWEKMLKCSLLTRNTVKRVLFEIEDFKRLAKEQFDNILIVSCAFESQIKIFDRYPENNESIIFEALNLVEQIEVKSPLLKFVIQTAWKHPKLRLLNESQLNDLYEFLNVKMNPKLFIDLQCSNEDFFPIEAFKDILKTKGPIGDDILDVIMFEDSQRNSFIDQNIEELFMFPLKKFENQKIVAECAILMKKTSIDFVISKEDFDCFEGNSLELFACSKFLESSNMWHSDDLKIESFKDALIANRYFNENSSEMNSIFDKLIFEHDENNKFIASIAQCLCLNPVLPVRSNILGGLIMRLNESGNCVPLLLLLASKHLENEKISKEFWRVQFREVYKEIITLLEGENNLRELQFRCAGNFWTKLENPEIEILNDCKFRGPLEKSFAINFTENDCNSFGLARLILFAAPFMRDSFDLSKLVEYCGRNRHIEPAMLLALRNVYLQLHLDEQLVAASVKLTEDSSIEETGTLIFPFYSQLIKENLEMQKFVVLLEMFVSAAEGSREDLKLLTGFAEVFKQRILSRLPFCNSIDPSEAFDFIPRNFDEVKLLNHVIYRLCMLFPLIIGGQLPRALFTSNAQEALQKREIERIRRQPRISVESIEIILKPLISATTSIINLKVKFADEIELVIDLKLPSDFPLSPVEVRGLDKSGLSDTKWRSALLSLQTLIRSSIFSGNLLEVTKRWQANALKLFQGLEECAVCYSVLHPSDKSLPGPACKQCKHKFHSTCLYKWFKSSGNATCPLCRALF